jgi:hypothetical protein
MADTITNDTLLRAYIDPVARLLTIGEADLSGPGLWPDYLNVYQLENEHIPDLIRMACDPALYDCDGTGLENWAPIHAWRALAQLRAAEAVSPLLEFTKRDIDDDAIAQELPTVFGMIGPAAIHRCPG